MQLNELAILYKNGKKEVFDELYNKSLPIVKAAIFSYVVNPDDAKDLVQTVFLRVHEKIKSYDAKSFENWIYTLAKNQAIELIRKKKEEKLEEINNISSNDNLNPCIRFALKHLTEEEKNIFLMKVLLNSSTKDLTKIFNLTPYEINKIYKDAKLKLKKELKGL